ncbi:hypothetical protein B0H13DRAFT_1550670, partial [Mycena leptocephala]
YKLRKHIGKAVQVRSKGQFGAGTVQAATMTPPKPKLSYTQVVEYTFLAEFDFLR